MTRDAMQMVMAWIILLMIASCPVTAASALGVPPAERTTELDSGDTDAGVQKLYLYMEEGELEHLYTRNPLSDERLDGYIRLSPDGEELELDGIRFRGTSSRFLPKKSFNIRFAEPQPFLFGSDTMNLKATYTDPTTMRENLSMDLFRRLDQPAPRTRYFDLYINDIYEGLFIHVERIDSNLLIHTGLNPDGMLLRDEFRANQHLPEISRLSVFGYPIDGVDEPEALLEQTMDTHGEADWEAFIELVSWVYHTPAGAEFEDGFRERFDADNFIDWLAIQYLIGDIDSFGDDYWLYLDTDDPEARWIVIPWDKDLTFGSHTRPGYGTANDYFGYEYPIAGGWDNELVSKFLATAELREELNIRMEYLMNEEFTKKYYSAEICQLEEIVGPRMNITPGDDAFVLHPQNHHGKLGYLPYHAESILDFVRLRYQFIKRNITPVQGEPYHASVSITPDQEGSTVSFTDAQGWVIANLEAEEINHPGTVSAEVRQLPFNPGVDRVWHFDTGGVLVNGTMTLYYRNDLPTFEHAGGNWFASTEPIEDDAGNSQWNLTICEMTEDGTLREMETYVNPYSNKASTNVSLQGEQQLVMVLDTPAAHVDNFTASMTNGALPHAV